MIQKCKILVLSDLDTSTEKIIKNGVNLAKIVDGEINFFCVKKATDIVEKESQLSAMRTINEKFLEVDNSIKKIIKSRTCGSIETSSLFFFNSNNSVSIRKSLNEYCIIF